MVQNGTCIATEQSLGAGLACELRCVLAPSEQLLWQVSCRTAWRHSVI